MSPLCACPSSREASTGSLHAHPSERKRPCFRERKLTSKGKKQEAHGRELREVVKQENPSWVLCTASCQGPLAEISNPSSITLSLPSEGLVLPKSLFPSRPFPALQLFPSSAQWQACGTVPPLAAMRSGALCPPELLF